MSKRYEDLKKKREQVMQMGGEKAVARQHDAGKMTARERLEYFFDEDTFNEIGTYVSHRQTNFGMAEKEIPAEGVITGYGKVSGRWVMVAAEDFTAMAGTFGEYHGKKFAHAIDKAKEMGIPFISMNDSGGARLQEGMDTLQAYGWLFQSQHLASGVIPRIALVMGPCLGGQAYHPAMQDFVIQCKETGFMGIAGPAFVKTQLNRDIDLETLCGVDAHARKSGCTHLVAEDDRDCLDKTRALLKYLPQNNLERPEAGSAPESFHKAVPELDNFIPEESEKYYDMHEVIYRLVDNKEFFEISPDFAKNILTGFGYFNGKTAGIVANQPAYLGGVINCDAADKVARFVRFCDLFNIPVVNLHDTPAYMIGPDEEWKGILRHGSKMLGAYIDAAVPKISVILRKSFAGAYLGMCCKHTGADFVFAWPEARISIVGAETAASVIFAREIKQSENQEEAKNERIKEYRELYENPYRAAERGYVDDVIFPSETRKRICHALEVLENKVADRSVTS